jgi:predicted RNase H-like HicB family nuclease
LIDALEARRCYDLKAMKTYTAVVEKDPDTNLYVGWIPGFPGAHSQGQTLDELNDNLREVVDLLREEGEPQMESIFIGTQLVTVDDQ